MAKYTPAQKRAVDKYKKNNNLVEMRATVTAEQRERYKAQAAAHGLSLTAYIVELLERDAKNGD